MKLLFERWRRYTKGTLLKENFYFVGDETQERPLAHELLSVLTPKLPGSVKAQLDPKLEAAGAEGIVISLDDKRVIKMFHSLDNAAKNLPLVSKNMPQTAQVYSTGKIALDQPVYFYKTGSSYTPEQAKPTKDVYYIVMQRVTPDPYIYRYVELGYDAFNRLSNVDLNKLVQLYQLGAPELQERVDSIFLAFMNSDAAANLPARFGSLEEFLQGATKKQRNITINEFNKFRKTKTKEFVMVNSWDRPVNLKKIILNYLGIENDVPYAKDIVQFLAGHPTFRRPPKKSFTKNTLAEDLQSIIGLVKEIRIDNKTPWNDIHQEQFGRSGDNRLVALDLGVKGQHGPGGVNAAAAFNKNVSQLSTRGETVKAVRESIGDEDPSVKTLNVFDFDKTLFFTPDAETGKERYEKVFGKEYPHEGWFGREESLADELQIEENETLRKIYDALSTDPSARTVVISNRNTKLYDRISQFLSDRGYNFDKIMLKKGRLSKVDRLENIWERYPEVDVVNVFDDREEPLAEYKAFRDRYALWRDDLQFNIFQVTGSEIQKI